MNFRIVLFSSLSLSLAQLCIGCNIVIGKYLMSWLSMYSFIFWRFLICGLVLLSFFARRKFTVVASKHPLGSLTSRDWFYLIAQSLCAGLIFNGIFFYGLQYTTATSAGIVSCSLPMVVALLAALMLRERLTAQKLAAIVLAMLGILIINIDNGLFSKANHGSFYGDVWIFASMFPEALYSIFSKKLVGRVSELGSAMVSGLMTAAGVVPLWWYQRYLPQQFSFDAALPWHGYGLIALSGVLTLIFFPLWGWGLRRIPVSSAAIFAGVVSIATSVLGYFFLHEEFGICDGIGMAVVFIALLLGALPKGSK